MTTFDSYVEQVLDRIPHHLPLRDQVAQDIRSTFADRQALGESADEAIRQLGNPTTLAESYLSAVAMTPAPFMARVGAKLVDTVLYGMVLPIPAIIYLRMTYSGTDPGPRNIAVFLMIGLIGMGFWLLSAVAETRYSLYAWQEADGPARGARIGYSHRLWSGHRPPAAGVPGYFLDRCTVRAVHRAASARVRTAFTHTHRARCVS